MVKYFRDPIYDYIKFEKRELNLIDCFLFQRLRGIHHQGTATFTYPSMNHTRFEHSLGVAYISTELLRTLAPLFAKSCTISKAEECREAVRVIALWHDIGMGPFSHVSDRVMSRYIREKISPHEWILLKIIKKYLPDFLTECGFKKPDSIAKKALEIADGSCKLVVLRQIFDGAVDADFIDYVSRSSYMLGSKGLLDIRRLIQNAIITKKGDLGFTRQAMSALEFAIIERYREFKYINFHHSVCFSDELMSRIMWNGIEERIFDRTDFTLSHYEALAEVDLENLRNPNEIAKPERIVDDHYIIQKARECGEDKVSSYINILGKRDFYAPLWKISTYLEPEYGGIVRKACSHVNQNMEKDPVKTMATIESFEEDLKSYLQIDEQPIISFKPYRPFKEEMAQLFLIFNDEYEELAKSSPIAWMFLFHKKLAEETILFKPPPELYYPLYIHIPKKYIKSEEKRKTFRNKAIGKLNAL